MTVIFSDLRQRVGELLEGTFVGPVIGGTTSTVVCGTFPIRDSIRDSVFVKAAIVRPGTAEIDVYRRVSADAPSTGTLTVDTVYSVAPVLGDTIELWRVFDPTRVVRHANRVMERLRFLEEVDLAGVNNQRQYSLAAYTWLTHPNQVIALLKRNGSVANEYQWSEMGWRITNDSGVLTLELTGAEATSADTLRIKALRDHASSAKFDSDASTSNPALVWLSYEVAADMLTMPATRRGTDMDPVSPLAVEEIRGHALYWRKWHTDRLAQAKPLFAPSQRAWGPVPSSGWRGW